MTDIGKKVTECSRRESVASCWWTVKESRRGSGQKLAGTGTFHARGCRQQLQIWAAETWERSGCREWSLAAGGHQSKGSAAPSKWKWRILKRV